MFLELILFLNTSHMKIFSFFVTFDFQMQANDFDASIDLKLSE
jgi:hypothetical protein